MFENRVVTKDKKSTTPIIPISVQTSKIRLCGYPLPSIPFVSIEKLPTPVPSTKFSID